MGDISERAGSERLGVFVVALLAGACSTPAEPAPSVEPAPSPPERAAEPDLAPDPERPPMGPSARPEYPPSPAEIARRRAENPLLSPDGATLVLPYHPALLGIDELTLLFVRASDGRPLRVELDLFERPSLADYVPLQPLHDDYAVVAIGAAPEDFAVEVRGHDEVAGLRPRGALQEGMTQLEVTVRHGTQEHLRVTISNEPPRFTRIPRHCHSAFGPLGVAVWIAPAEELVLLRQLWRSGSDECHPWRWTVARFGGEIVATLDESDAAPLR